MFDKSAIIKSIFKYLLVLYFLVPTSVAAQFYIRGIVNDDKGRGLYGAKMILKNRSSIVFETGNTGSFGLPSRISVDSIIIYADGFDTMHTIAYANRFNIYHLQILPEGLLSGRHKIISFSKDSLQQQNVVYYHGAESYAAIVENDFLETSGYPQTGFALHIDRASYSNIRRFIHNEMTVPPDAVRIEEMLNYFDISLQKDTISTDGFHCETMSTKAPWKNGNKLFFVNIEAPSLKLDSLPPTNLIFLVDVSGSMDQPNRLPLIQQGLKMLSKNLRTQDTIAIVVYGGITAILLQPTSGSDKEHINNAIDQLNANGDTPGESALRLAYNVAKRMYHPSAQNRIILTTDGDFNVGLVNDMDLEDLVQQYRNTGIYLSCIGVGMGNYKNSKLEGLARKGNGNFAYIDALPEAEKIFVAEFTKSLFTVANDVYATVDFNPQYVKRYRLIGFDNKASELKISNTEIEGGELGAAHHATAVFEYEPLDSNYTLPADASFADITLHYKPINSNSDTTVLWQMPYNYIPWTKTDSTIKFATSIIMFGELLKKSKLINGFSWDELISFTTLHTSKNSLLQNELIQLMQAAKKIYADTPKHKKKKKDTSADER